VLKISNVCISLFQPVKPEPCPCNCSFQGGQPRDMLFQPSLQPTLLPREQSGVLNDLKLVDNFPSRLQLLPHMPSFSQTLRLQVSSESFEFICQALQRTNNISRLFPGAIHCFHETIELGPKAFKVELSFPHSEFMQTQEQWAMIRDVRGRALQHTIRKKLLLVHRCKDPIKPNKSWGLPLIGPSESPAHKMNL
jgi:hypothetical protein